MRQSKGQGEGEGEGEGKGDITTKPNNASNQWPICGSSYDPAAPPACSSTLLFSAPPYPHPHLGRIGDHALARHVHQPLRPQQLRLHELELAITNIHVRWL